MKLSGDEDISQKTRIENSLKNNFRPGAVAHACNLALWEAEGSGSREVRSSRPAWPTYKTPSLQKYKN